MIKHKILLFLIITASACSNEEPYSTITCNEFGCSGRYIGPEFDNSKPKGKKDIAHQFSNKIADRVGDELKKLYIQNKYSKVDLENISMSTQDMNGTGNVTYKIHIPFVQVSDSCDAFTAFDHRGGWNHIIKERGVRKEFVNKRDVQLIEKKTKEGLQEFWIQFKHKDYQSGCK
jgi:hypothetical protein